MGFKEYLDIENTKQPSNKDLLTAIVYYGERYSKYELFYHGRESFVYKLLFKPVYRVCKDICQAQQSQDVEINDTAIAGKVSYCIAQFWFSLKFVLLLVAGNALWDLIKWIYGG